MSWLFFFLLLWISAPSIVRLATWKTTQTEMGDSVPFDPTIPYLRRHQIYGGNKKCFKKTERSNPHIGCLTGGGAHPGPQISVLAAWYIRFSCPQSVTQYYSIRVSPSIPVHPLWLLSSNTTTQAALIQLTFSAPPREEADKSDQLDESGTRIKWEGLKKSNWTLFMENSIHL